MRIAFAFILLALSACGVHHTFDEMKSEPVSGHVNVTYTVTIDYGALEGYFVALCEQEQAEDIETCKALKLTQFFAALAAAAPGAVVPAPSPTAEPSPEPSVEPTPEPTEEPSPVPTCRKNRKGKCRD